mmetsp:Transcript_26581/g.58866  ORF Transcript_26581/g.58866 Transcript_26581/m.58866 type:complete len:434 (+) Transcript_26581:82-1383(+)
MATAAELRQILKEDGTGKNLYDHLTETLMKILIDRPKDAYDSFELISADVKANPLNPDPEKGKPVPPSADEVAKMVSWANACATLLKNPEEPPEESGVKYPDLLDDANLYEWAGVSFGKGELYRLYLSVKKLTESLPGEVERLRLVGKINTRSLPYFILEGVCPDEIDPTAELEGKAGSNKYSYWVTQNVESAHWHKLPNVTCAQIVQARQFRRLFTGTLDSPVPSYPPFDGTEENLLRAQIALIVGATSISPDGYFDLDDEDPPTVRTAEAEAMAERFPKTSGELKDAEGWRHHEPELNRLGRVTALPEALDDAGEPIEDADPVEATPLLDAIKPEGWTFRVCPGGVGTAAGSVVVARSLVWPGAVAVTVGRKWVNIYVGSGVAYTATAYSPPLPAPIQGEWAAPDEEGVLLEAADTRADPTPPKPEGEEEE